MICSQCNTEFIKSSGAQKYCSTICAKKKIHETSKKYQLENKEKLKTHNREFMREYVKTNKFKEYLKRYRSSKKGKATMKRYYQKDSAKILAKKSVQNRKENGTFQKRLSKYEKNRRKNDPIFRLSKALRSRLLVYLKTINAKKTNSTFKLIGCSPQFLKEYLEKKFSSGMTWNNHSKLGWHIDHIIPLSSAKTEKDIEKLMNYTNLQPMWATENIKKGNRII